MLLMGLVIFGFMWLNQPSEAELAQRREAERQAEAAARQAEVSASLGVVDTITAAELASLKATVQQFGYASTDGKQSVYTLENGGVSITLEDGEFKGSITLEGGSSGDIAEALSPNTNNVAFHNRLVAKVRELIDNYTKNGTFANFLNGNDSKMKCCAWNCRHTAVKYRA